MEKRIYILSVKQEEIVLRQKTAPFDFALFTKKEIRELLATMRLTMQRAQGVGLSANQIGLNLSVFVAQVDKKLYAVFNPTITKVLKGAHVLEEGCLSVPGCFGDVERPRRVWVEGQDANGKKLKIKTHGLLARVFQHEIDHLHGVLFIDRVKEVYTHDLRKIIQNS